MVGAVGVGVLASVIFLLKKLERRGDVRALRMMIVVLTMAWLSIILLVTVPGINPQAAPPKFNLIPFRASGNPLVILGNAAMFTPLGIIFAFAVRRAVATAVLVASSTSIAIEVVQFLLNEGRSADVTDVLMNTSGAACGALFGVFVLRSTAGSRAQRQRQSASPL